MYAFAKFKYLVNITTISSQIISNYDRIIKIKVI